MAANYFSFVVISLMVILFVVSMGYYCFSCMDSLLGRHIFKYIPMTPRNVLPALWDMLTVFQMMKHVLVDYFVTVWIFCTWILELWLRGLFFMITYLMYGTFFYYKPLLLSYWYCLLLTEILKKKLNKKSGKNKCVTKNTDKNLNKDFGKNCDKNFLKLLSNCTRYMAGRVVFWICFNFLTEQHKFFIFNIDKKVEKTFNKLNSIFYDSDKSLNKNIDKTFINCNDKHLTFIYFLSLKIIFLLSSVGAIYVLKFMCLKYMFEFQTSYLKGLNSINECLGKDFVSCKLILRNLPIKFFDIMKKTLIKICDFRFSHLVLKPSYRVPKFSSTSKKLTLEISNIPLDMKYITEQNKYLLFTLFDLKTKSLRFYSFFFYCKKLSPYFYKVNSQACFSKQITFLQNLISLNNFNLLPWLLKMQK